MFLSEATVLIASIISGKSFRGIRLYDPPHHSAQIDPTADNSSSYNCKNSFVVRNCRLRSRQKVEAKEEAYDSFLKGRKKAVQNYTLLHEHSQYKLREFA